MNGRVYYYTQLMPHTRLDVTVRFHYIGYNVSFRGCFLPRGATNSNQFDPRETWVTKNGWTKVCVSRGFSHLIPLDIICGSSSSSQKCRNALSWYKLFPWHPSTNHGFKEPSGR